VFIHESHTSLVVTQMLGRRVVKVKLILHGLKENGEHPVS
jgi:hypothetical protein